MTTAPPAHGRRVAVATALALTLTGCSSSGSSGETSASPTDISDSADITATITYALWDQSQVAGIEENVAAFNDEYPNVTVNVDVTPWGDYWTKRQTEASSDTLPDLFWMNGPNFQLYAANGKLEPITGQIDSDAIDPSKYPSALVDLYTYDDVVYGVPKDFDTIGVWVNTTLLDLAGVDLPSDDWSWDDFASTASAISTALEDQGVYGAASDLGGQTGYYNTIFQAGGSVIVDGQSGYDTPEAQTGLQFWTDLIASGASPSVPQLADTAADQWFIAGKLALYQGGSWFRAALTDLDFRDDITVLPLPRGEQQATVIHGVANVVAANSQNKEAAQAFQAFLASKEAQLTQAETGVVSAYEDTQGTFVETMPNANLQVFLDATAYARPLPVSANTAAWNAFETELLPTAFSGEHPVPVVAAELAERMNAALAAE